jgi:2-polyprenyl-6-methoxyphenol hydroxylase-like FAD-dependent oxidoreductase
MIIGAGLGGLALAHGLRRVGIEVDVFERGNSLGAQPASYGIHLDTNGLRALHACIPEENWRLLDAVAAPARDLVRFHDPRLRTLAVLDREDPATVTDPITRRRGIRRDGLREALLRGLDTDGIVAWGKRFDRYEDLPRRQVRARFADGTHADGDLLVGADGSNSRVRQQRLPDVHRQDLGIVNIAGSTPLTAALAGLLPDTLTDGSVNNVLPTGPGWMFLATWRAPECRGAARTGRDQVVWAWVGGRSSYPPGVEQLPGEVLQRLVTDRVHGWAPALRGLVADTDPCTIAPVTLRTMPTLPHWPASTVTLLGDAIHSMTPMGGVGANTALRDADTLRRALTGYTTGQHPLPQAIAEYEHRMRGYANDALSVSTRNARNAASDKRLPRLGFRVLLRAAEAVPPLKRAVFRTG